MIDIISGLFLLFIAIFLVGCGALTSSVLNRRILRRIGLDIEHIKRNQRATREASEYFRKKHEDSQE